MDLQNKERDSYMNVIGSFSSAKGGGVEDVTMVLVGKVDNYSETA